MVCSGTHANSLIQRTRRVDFLFPCTWVCSPVKSREQQEFAEVDDRIRRVARESARLELHNTKVARPKFLLKDSMPLD
jgi:hypothetical protein